MATIATFGSPWAPIPPTHLMELCRTHHDHIWTGDRFGVERHPCPGESWYGDYADNTDTWVAHPFYFGREAGRPDTRAWPRAVCRAMTGTASLTNFASVSGKA